MSTLERAVEIAVEAHAGQLDKAGKEYIGHPFRVISLIETSVVRYSWIIAIFSSGEKLFFVLLCWVLLM